MNKAYLLIGGNMGDRLANLNEAIHSIRMQVGTIEKTSAIYETAAWGFTEQPAFLNQALFVNTMLSAHELLQTLLTIENKLGRKRAIHMGPRTIDIDVIYFNNEVLVSENLIIPHPSMYKRNFVLIPLVEIAPDFIHPVFHKGNTMLLAACTDDCLVQKKINF